MAKVFLESGDSWIIANNGAEVFGGAGDEQVIINSGVTGIELDANVERADLAGNVADYTFQQQGNQLVAFSGGVAVMYLPVQEDGSQVVFADGSVEVTLDASGMQLGGSEVPTTEGAVVPATIDDTVTSDAGDGGDAPVEGQTFTLTASTADILVGTTGDDTFEGAADTYQDTDRIVDNSTTDNDTFNLTETAAPTPDVVNVENINVNLNSLSALAVDASKISGADVMTVTRGDVVVGGSTLTGNKAVRVDNADSAGVAKIIAGAGTTTVDVNAAASDKAGLVVDASTATGNVTVDGAATIMAGASTGTVSVDAVSNTTAAETGKATSISADAAATVTTHADLTGSVEIEAAKASTITVNDAQGGATVTGGTTSTADTTITVSGIDASGATITTGTGSATAAEKQITVNLDGTAQSTDAATISAAGVVALDAGKTANAVDALTLSGNGAAVTYNMSVTNEAITSITGTGGQAVTVAGDEAFFSGKTVTDISVLDLNAGTAGAIDASKWTNVDKVDLGFDNQANTITVSEGAYYSITADQTAGITDFAYTTGATNMTIAAGDVNGAANTAVGTLTLNTLDAAAGATDEGTVAIVANDANMTVTNGTTVGAKQVITVEGDEDVNLGTVTAKSVNASASTGIITMTATTGVSDTVATGSGNDVLTANGGDVHSFAAGAGNDAITVTDTQATSQFDGGAGNDTVNMNKAGVAYVVVGGEGNDTFKTAVDIDAVVVGGAGTDTLEITGGTLDLADNTNFAFSAIEALNLTSAAGATTISAAQLANNDTFAITADGDQLNVEIDPAGNNVGGSLDASGISIATGSTAVLNYVGSTKDDIITGGVEDELFTMTKGDDTIDGGTKTGDADQFTAALVADNGTAAGTVINLSGSDVSATDILSSVSLRTAGDAAATAGTAQTLFDNTTATNDASVTSLTNIESVVGTANRDYIVAGTTGNTINGGDNADYIKLGSGSDIVTLVEGESVASTDASFAGANVAADDTITFGNGVDVISSFQAGAGGDVLKGVNAAEAPTTGIGVATANGFTGDTFFLSGNFDENTGVFTIKGDGVGADTMILDVENHGANALSAVDDAVILVGVDSADLVDANFAVA